jgi:hypothetical protein
MIHEESSQTNREKAVLPRAKSRQPLVVARHDGDSTKLQTLCEMHGSDKELTRCDLDPVTEFECLNTGLFDGRFLPAILGAFEFITKPVDFDQLKVQLRQLSAAAD